jgi:DNA-binding IclR family transcriptional regulator
MNAAEKKNLGNAQLRLLKVIEALSGHEVFGIRLKEVAETVQSSAPTVLRDLQALESSGYARQDENGLWRLDTRLVQIATHFYWGIQAAGQRIEEIHQRYTRKPE